MTHLTVHEWARVPIGPDGFSRPQADALLAAARAHALGGDEGTGILCDHHRHLTARQVVGVIAAGGCSLEILPKVDPHGADEAPDTVRARLVNMLDVAHGLDLSVGESAAMAHRADALLDLFIGLFANRLLSEAWRGLPRRYRGHEDDLGALRGRLDIVRQFTVHAARPDRLACRFDALAIDTPLLRVMKACIVLLARHARRVDTRRKLAELRFLLADVADVAPASLPWAAAQVDRTSRRWRALLDLARLLLGERWQQTHADARQPQGVTLLFAMNDLFERYVAVQLRRALAPSGLDVTSQGGFAYCLGEWRGDAPCTGSVFRTRPDLLVRRGGRVVAVVDAKWKRLSADPTDAKQGVRQADVYQMMAYARLYGCDRVMLLYPAAGDAARDVHTHGIAGGRERFDIATVPVGAGDDEVRKSLLRSMAFAEVGHVSE